MHESVQRFEFAQAVRLLERLAPERAPVGFDADPAGEVVRFVSDVSAVFPRGEVRELVPGADAQPPTLTVNFMGVATPASYGSLPDRYAEEIRALVREKNTALRDFLDLFNHRLVSLFFRARARHHPVLEIERGSENALERVLRAVIGIGTARTGDRLALADRALLGRAGLLAARPLSAVALEALLESYFELPVEVLQFQPARYEIAADERNRLGVSSTRLGEDLYLGCEITLADAKLRLRIGPLDGPAFARLLPDQPGFRELVDLVRFATRDGVDFDVQLALVAEDVPELRLGGDGDARGRLGWSSWLAGRERSDPAMDSVLRADCIAGA